MPNNISKKYSNSKQTINAIIFKNTTARKHSVNPFSVYNAVDIMPIIIEQYDANLFWYFTKYS